MHTEMLIGSRFRQGRRRRGDRPQPKHRRDDRYGPRSLDRTGRRGGRRRRRGPSPNGRARRPASAPAISCSSPTASRPRRRISPTLEALNCGKPLYTVIRDEMPAVVDVLPLLRRRGARRAGVGGRRIPARLHLDGPPRPDRRRRVDRAVELSADDGGLEDRARRSPPATPSC